MIKKIKEILTTDSSGSTSTDKSNKEKKIIMIDPAALGLDDEAGPPPEPDLRIIGLFADVHEEKIAELIHGLLVLDEMNKLTKEDKRKPIEFYISTYGGNADDMFGLYDVIRQVKETSEIHTIGLGKVMSAGVLLLASGTKGKRKIGKNCRVMIHSVMGGNHGSLHNMMNELEAIEQLQDMYCDALIAETKLTRAKLKKMIERKVNVYLSAEEAVELGIADIII
tara:strand:- start:2627 stop:3298 length:672 start_codon:yes stop_codon:yes gene_type:complete